MKSTKTKTFSQTKLRAFQDQLLVVKIGGNSIENDKSFLSRISKQIFYLNQIGINVILVHGGGPQIDRALARKKILTLKRKDGRRITSEEAIPIVSDVMGQMNLKIVKSFIKAGLKKERIVAAADFKKNPVKAISLDPRHPKKNRSGRPIKVETTYLKRALKERKLVILHSMAIGANGLTYNTNGDDYAMCIASALKAKRLILVTHVRGVLDEKGKRIPVITPVIAKKLIKKGIITDGMIAKVQSALKTVHKGVGEVAIIDGLPASSLMEELMATQGLGTRFVLMNHSL